jgi:hypothetical protein
MRLISLALLIAAVGGCQRPANRTAPGAGDSTTQRPDSASQPADPGQPMTVGALLGAPPSSGTNIRVSGKCYGLAGTLARGPQPRSRSDWQLGNDTVAVYVTGPSPTECLQAPAPPVVTIRALVQRDTVALSPVSQPVVRVFLRSLPPS